MEPESVDWEERVEGRMDLLEPWAALARTALQMLVGVLLVLRLVWFVKQGNLWGPAADSVAPPAQGVLTIVGSFLALSTAVELAYFLFTPGPDEAYSPVLLALATAALLLGGAVTTGGTQWPEVGGLVAVVVLLVAMIVLKPWVEERLADSALGERRRKEKRKAERRNPTLHTAQPSPRYVTETVSPNSPPDVGMAGPPRSPRRRPKPETNVDSLD